MCSMRRIVFVVSEQDQASVLLGRCMEEAAGARSSHIEGDLELSVYDDHYILKTGKLHINADGVDKELERSFGVRAEGLVFLSSHRSSSGRPAITFHSVGNFGEAELGGRGRKLVQSMPTFMTGCLTGLKNVSPPGYDVTYEATHHGPYIEVPCMFAEIGSDESAWKDIRAAESIVRVLLSSPHATGLNAVGIGGGHYCSRFREIALKYRINFGHIVSDYNLHYMDMGMASELAEKSPATGAFLLHTSARNREEVSRVAKLLENAGMENFTGSELQLR